MKKDVSSEYISCIAAFEESYLSLVRSKPKVLDRLTRVLRAPQQERIRPSRCLQRQLIQRQALSSGLLDPSTCRRGKAKCGNRELRDG